MSPDRSDESSSIFAYAIGVGLVFVPLIGIPLRFAFQEIAPLLVYAGAFLLGGAGGALLAPRRKGPARS